MDHVSMQLSELVSLKSYDWKKNRKISLVVFLDRQKFEPKFYFCGFETVPEHLFFSAVFNEKFSIFQSYSLGSSRNKFSQRNTIEVSKQVNKIEDYWEAVEAKWRKRKVEFYFENPSVNVKEAPVAANANRTANSYARHAGAQHCAARRTTNC